MYKSSMLAITVLFLTSKLETEPKVPEGPFKSHIIFLLDNSGSMRTRDIASHKDKITRRFATKYPPLILFSEAVFKSCANFVSSQLHSFDVDQVICSLVMFNDAPQAIFEARKLDVSLSTDIAAY